MTTMRKRLLRLCKWTVLACAAWVLAFALVWHTAEWIYLPDQATYFGSTMPEDVRGALNHFYWVWENPERRAIELGKMRAQNPEWDLITRSFFAYSLANVALQYPEERQKALTVLDQVIDDTVQVPWREFLLPYGHRRPFMRRPASSLMVDGEVGLMIGLRRLVMDDKSYPHRDLHRELIERTVQAIEASPVLCAESYPDECWLWCTPLALASIKVFDILEGSDHSPLFARFERTARQRLIQPETGLLYSAVTLDGRMIHPPEGSTLWIGVQCLLPVAPDLAREQYAQLKEKLIGRIACFRFGREWPVGREGEWDIDSGFTPFGMGPASTGFALVASKEMEDPDLFVRLLGLLEFAAVARVEDGRLRYLSSNLVGDASFLFAKTTGPAWKEVARRSPLNKSGNP